MANENASLFKSPDVSVNKPATASPKSFQQLHDLKFLCNPAFTEASLVGCHYEAFQTTARRLSYEEEQLGKFQFEHYQGFPDLSIMDLDLDPHLQRTASHHSNASRKSSRSQTVRARPRKYSAYVSSSASSISDKSLTSFPSFSPESPKDERAFQLRMEDGTAQSSRKPSDPPSTIVESLTVLTPSAQSRSALFDDAPLTTSHIPGALHLANNEHIERLIARNGAVALVRQIAEDLAQRDTQVAALRRKGEERERALRKIILECGLSNLDLETRLRAIEGEHKAAVETSKVPTTKDTGLVDMMTDAMSETVVFGGVGTTESDATIRARDALRAIQENKPPNTNATRGWKDYIWGTGTSRKSSRASSINEDSANGTRATAASVRNGSIPGRQTILENGIFQPPETTKPASRSSSIHSGSITNLPVRDRKSSSGLATLALKLVAGATARDDGTNGRGRANSTGTSPAGREQSAASVKTNISARTAPVKPATKAIPALRRPTVSASSGVVARGQQSERWDTMGTSPENTRSAGADSYGPVEMDTILPPDAQPPTVTATYNNTYNQEFLTDRFGFIYDQRRKKRQREAAEKVQKSKRGSRVEMLSSARSAMSPEPLEEVSMDERPDTPVSIEEDGKPAKRWQDYLKIATFPTELLSHTPSGGIPAFEVMEGGEVPRSPGITTEERGFLPSSSTSAAPPAISVTSDHATISKPDTAAPDTPTALSHEDTEPVRLLLKQLGDVHDSLQKEKTMKWNDFLRKVRAERKREGEAAAAAALAADPGSQRAITIMPEASLTDGEMIGVAGLGNKGKVGRAKWAEFKMLLLGGIPVAYRAKIWAECSGATALRIPGYYEDLAHKDGDDDPSIVAQIQMDINRTLTDNIFFRRGAGVAKLKEVLLAYSRRNPEVGYCQGMNLITACLLLIMPTAEDAFWVLTSIIENTLPRGYYDHSLLASRADQQVLRQYVTEILPKLSAHFDDLSIELETLTFQWFLSVFTDCLSAEALFRVWDVVLCTNDGSTFLFQVALALLKLNESQLLHCDTPATVYTYINHQMTNHAISIDGLIHASEGLRKVVKRDEVETRRGLAIETEKDLIRQREERNAQRRAERIAAVNGNYTKSQVTENSTAATLEEGQLELGSDASGELTVRTPLPVEEDAELELG
ncbi:TBC domain-containing [Hyphodiscus hymeniophilus]|uniref:TBC domain-containing n=1 Tax=Hyphodiscus hymeniophilus TaxID=353542 RepID=A0A9P6VE79_9HELO|nr:TBC domain-containing [Hyphodiscus hymeniophilus]